MYRVCIAPAANAGSCSTAARNAAFVSTPATRTSRNARAPRATTAAKSGDVSCTMTFASSESNAGFVAYPARA